MATEDTPTGTEVGISGCMWMEFIVMYLGSHIRNTLPAGFACSPFVLLSSSQGLVPSPAHDNQPGDSRIAFPQRSPTWQKV